MIQNDTILCAKWQKYKVDKGWRMENDRKYHRGGMVEIRTKEQLDYYRIALQFSLRTSTFIGPYGTNVFGHLWRDTDLEIAGCMINLSAEWRAGLLHTMKMKRNLTIRRTLWSVSAPKNSTPCSASGYRILERQYLYGTYTRWRPFPPLSL